MPTMWISSSTNSLASAFIYSKYIRDPCLRNISTFPQIHLWFYDQWVVGKKQTTFWLSMQTYSRFSIINVFKDHDTAKIKLRYHIEWNEKSSGLRGKHTDHRAKVTHLQSWWKVCSDYNLTDLFKWGVHLLSVSWLPAQGLALLICVCRCLTFSCVIVRKCDLKSREALLGLRWFPPPFLSHHHHFRSNYDEINRGFHA